MIDRIEYLHYHNFIHRDIKVWKVRICLTNAYLLISKKRIWVKTKVGNRSTAYNCLYDALVT